LFELKLTDVSRADFELANTLAECEAAGGRGNRPQLQNDKAGQLGPHYWQVVAAVARTRILATHSSRQASDSDDAHAHQQQQ
jgi:hypothetical protein